MPCNIGLIWHFSLHGRDRVYVAIALFFRFSNLYNWVKKVYNVYFMALDHPDAAAFLVIFPFRWQWAVVLRTMEHLSETCQGKENCEMVNILNDSMALRPKWPAWNRTESPLGRSRLGSTGAKLPGVHFKPLWTSSEGLPQEGWVTCTLKKKCSKRGVSLWCNRKTLFVPQGTFQSTVLIKQFFLKCEEHFKYLKSLFFHYK